MDPVVTPIVLAISGMLIGGTMLKTIECYLSRGATGSVAISAPTAGENYDLRWNDPEYVKLIHKTMDAEEAELGEIFTDCDCSEHKIAKLLPKAKTTRPGTEIKHNKFVVDGYIFNIRDDVVPATAYGEWDSRMQCGVFRWVDSKTGKMMMIRALPAMDAIADSYDIYSDQHMKPVAQIKPMVVRKCAHAWCDKKVASTDTYCYLHVKASGPKNHIMFTAKGPVRMDEAEMKQELRKVREIDQKKRRGTASMGPN